MKVSRFNGCFAQSLLASLVLLILSSTPLLCQNFTIGIKAGPLATWSVYGDKDYGETIDNKAAFGFAVGGLLNFPLKNNYTCVFEGGYSRRGRNVVFSEGNNQNKATYRFLDGTLLLRKSFQLNLGKDIPGKWFFNIGPHVSYWLSGEGRVGTTENDGKPYTVKFTDAAGVDLGDFNTMFMVDANRWLFGADIGIGMEAPIKATQKILLECRFTWGHTYFGGKATQNYSWVEFTDTNLQANEKIISLTAAYTFDIDLRENKKGRSTKDRETHRKPVKKRRR